MKIKIPTTQTSFNIPEYMIKKISLFSGKLNTEWPTVHLLNDWTEDDYLVDYYQYDSVDDYDDICSGYYDEINNKIKLLTTALKKYNNNYIISEEFIYHELCHKLQFDIKHWAENEYILYEPIAEIVSAILSSEKPNKKNYKNYFNYHKELNAFWILLDYILKLDDVLKLTFIKDYLTNRNFWKIWFSNKSNFIILLNEVISNNMFKRNKKNNIINFINKF